MGSARKEESRTVLLAGAYFVGLGVLFLGGWQVSRALGLEVQVSRVHSTGPVEARYSPGNRGVAGPQLLLLYIGSAGCPFANRPELPPAVELIKVHLASIAKDRGMSFKAMGVALDWIPEDGLRHLAKFGRFDEVSSGYSWGNSLAIQYLWQQGLGQLATPQVLVLQRTLVLPSGHSEDVAYGEVDVHAVTSKSGITPILSWVDSGFPLPTLFSAAR